MMPTRIETVLLALALSLAACSAPAPSAPSPVSQAQVPVLSPLVSVSGGVVDTAFRPLPGAKIEILDGPLAGTSTMSDSESRFTLTGPFDRATRFQATKNAHGAITRTANVFCDRDCYGALEFDLPVLDPPTNIRGNYTLTFRADPACTDLPDEARIRTYAATIASSSDPDFAANTHLIVTLSGATFVGGYQQFTVGVAGDQIGVFANGADSAAVVEQLARSTYVAFSGAGSAIATPGDPAITASFDGWIEYCAVRSPIGSRYNCGTLDNGQLIPGERIAYGQCASKNHQLILTRR
jgi:hypothetical protein